jgi:hypothetical protein
MMSPVSAFCRDVDCSACLESFCQLGHCLGQACLARADHIRLTSLHHILRCLCSCVPHGIGLELQRAYRCTPATKWALVIAVSKLRKCLWVTERKVLCEQISFEDRYITRRMATAIVTLP